MDARKQLWRKLSAPLIRVAAVVAVPANRADGVGGQTGTLEHGAEGIAGDGVFEAEGGARRAEATLTVEGNEVDGEVESA